MAPASLKTPNPAYDQVQIRLQRPLRRLPDELLKLPVGHTAQLPADTPPHPLKYRPAPQAAALQGEQTEAPERSIKHKSARSDDAGSQ